MINHILRYCTSDAMRTAELPNLAAEEGMLDPLAVRWSCMGVLVDLIITQRVTVGYFNAEEVFEPVAMDLNEILEACLIEWGTGIGDWPDPSGLWLTCTAQGRAEGRQLIMNIGEWFDEPAVVGGLPKIRDETRLSAHALAVLGPPRRSLTVSERAVSEVLAAGLDVPPQWQDHVLVGFTVDWAVRGQGPLTLVTPALTSRSWGKRASAVGREAFVADRKSVV